MTTSTNWIANDDGVRRLASERCTREVECNNVGKDRKYADHDACMRELQHDIGIDLRTNECPRGLDGRAFDECLTAVHDEKCANPFDAVTRLRTCRTGKLCIR